MAVTIDDIKKLRELTGVSMSACKLALVDSEGNFDKAIEYLKKKGEAKMSDRAERTTLNGVISVKISGKEASIVKVLCETDFVARADDFIHLSDDLAEKLLVKKINESDTNLSEISDATLKLGEKIAIGDMKLVSGNVIGSYIHSNKKIGVVVVLKSGDESVARDIAMHIAAINPMVLSPDEVDQNLVNKEREIWVEQLKNENKPSEIIEKILIGKEKKFKEENALLKQNFVKDPSVLVEDYLKINNSEIESFVRFSV